MSKLVWGSPSGVAYELGIDRGVLYTRDGKGAYAWNGIISVDEKHSDAEESIRFYDGTQFRNKITLGQYSVSVNSFTYPEVLDLYEEVKLGLQANDTRKGNTLFNFSYRTLTDKGYRIHLVYNASATPSQRSHASLEDTISPETFSWDIETIPVKVFEAAPSSHFFIDSDMTRPWILEAIENMLYGWGEEDPHFPIIDELIEMFQDGSILRITDHHDGTWTATGPDDVVNMLSPTMFEIISPTAIYVGPDKYKVSSN